MGNLNNDKINILHQSGKSLLRHAVIYFHYQTIYQVISFPNPNEISNHMLCRDKATEKFETNKLKN